MRKRFAIAFPVLFALMYATSVSIPHAATWTLVDFGTSDATSTTPTGDWTEILRHPSNVQYVDPDGNPDHQGVTEIASLGEEDDDSYIGIRGTTPISFQRGHKIICTFYNRSENDQFFHARISLTDANSPDPADTGKPWFTLHGDIGYGLEGYTSVAMEYYIADASMVNHFNSPTTTGSASLINVNKRYPNSDIVLTKIEYSDEADITSPAAPGNLEANLVSTTTGADQNLVRIDWDPSTDPGSNATGVDRYLIYRDGSLYDCLQNDMVDYYDDDLHYIDSNIAPGSTHTYQVTAVDTAPFGIYPTTRDMTRRHGNESPLSNSAQITAPAWTSSLLDPWSELQYAGDIRLPADLEDFMDYASDGIAYYPGGNASYDSRTEWPGSLYLLTRQCERICEITIPKPVDSQDIESVVRASTLQTPVDLWPRIYDGNWFPDGGGGGIGGISYHPGGNGVGGYLYYGISDFYGVPEDAPTHGVFDLDLTKATGAWHIGGTPPNHVSPALNSTILFEIPQSWADANCGGRSLIVGSAYIAGSGVPSHGPSLYAVAPWESGHLPANGGSCTAVELLRYSSGADTEHRVNDWAMGEWGQGGAWLESGSHNAVALSYVRSMGDSWYGDSEGTFGSLDDIPEPPFGEKGTSASYWQRALMLYNSNDLAAVAAGSMQSWEPQPYCVYDIDRFSKKSTGFDDWLGDHANSIAYDSANRRLFMIRFNGDPEYEWGYGIVQTWELPAAEAPTDTPTPLVTVTPTEIQIYFTPTPTDTDTPTETPTSVRLLMDGNDDGVVDERDLMLLMKEWTR